MTLWRGGRVAIGLAISSQVMLAATSFADDNGRHDHDQDDMKVTEGIPFLFDSHIGGNWGTAYKGFRMVEIMDDNTVATYILNPDAKIVAGFEPIMPSYQGQLSEEEILQLLAFLKTLQPGQTPPRIDTAAPPSARPNPFGFPWRQP